MRRIISAGFLAMLLVASAAAQAGKPINAKCPIKGEPVNLSLTATYKGQTIGFCWNGCKSNFAANPEGIAEKMPEFKAAMAAMAKSAAAASTKNMTGACDCKRVVKGYYCEKDKRELSVDDVRGNVCKRCEEKATQIEYCLKLIMKPIDPKKKVQDPPGEDKARISYICETCMNKGEIESDFKHKPDCKPSFSGGLKKICAKSGHVPHASEVK